MNINIKKFFSQVILFSSFFAVATHSWAAGDHEGDHAHDDEHGHSDEPALVYTDYNELTELFVEFPPLVVGKSSTFVSHFTRMDNFQPLTSGLLDVHLKTQGRTVARFRVREPARTGIFLPSVTPRNPGEYELILELVDGDLHSIHNLGMVTVFSDEQSAVINQEEPEGDISYLKEQQWVNPFAITQSASRPLRRSVPGFATVTAPADGFAEIRAPSDGYFSTSALINAGNIVKREQILGTIIPRLGEGADIGNLLVGQERARSQLQLAQADVERLKSLFTQGAVSEKRFLEAQKNLDIARVEFETAESRVKQRTGNSSKAGITLRAPINGEVVSAAVTPGSFVRSGDRLFSLADSERRWINVQVPEKFGGEIRHATGAWLLQNEKSVVLDNYTGARLVKISQQVDPVSRTVDLAIEYPSKLGPSLIGHRFEAHVFVGESQSVLSVPVSALLDDGGQTVIYVQTSGETFARRSVVTGIRDGNWVEIISGVNANEWVVSNGAYYVKLAATGNDAIGHGHAH